MGSFYEFVNDLARGAARRFDALPNGSVGRAVSEQIPGD